MIGYVTVGALNVDKSLPFWDAVFAPLGYERGFHSGGWAGYGPKGETQNTYICPPFDGQTARGGNGIMIGFLAPNVDAVKAAHAAGLAAGERMRVAPDRGLKTQRTSTAPTCAIRRATRSACSRVDPSDHDVADQLHHHRRRRDRDRHGLL